MTRSGEISCKVCGSAEFRLNYIESDIVSLHCRRCADEDLASDYRQLRARAVHAARMARGPTVQDMADAGKAFLASNANNRGIV